jgi:predicted DNA-binding protein
VFEVPLSAEAVALLRNIAAKVGMTPEEFARRAILDTMEDTEDYLLAEERLSAGEETVSLEEVMERYPNLEAAHR